MSKATLVILEEGTSSVSPADGEVLRIRSGGKSDDIISWMKSSVGDNSFDEVKASGFPVDDDLLEQIFRCLNHKGKFSVENAFPDRDSGQAYTSNLKLQGFVKIMAAKDSVTGDRFIVCEKPENWNIGASASISIALSSSSNNNTNINSNNNNSSRPVWKMSMQDMAENDLVDESSLLNDGLDTKRRGDLAGCSGDVGDVNSGRKACKNCSCGLAEEEEKAIQAGVKPVYNGNKSACGNCSKGDAFRCAGCPFLGKPAFQPGQEKLVLSLGIDDI